VVIAVGVKDSHEILCEKAARASAAPERVQHLFKHLFDSQLRSANDAESIRILATVASGSSTLTETLIVHPEWSDLIAPERLVNARRIEGLRRDVGGVQASASPEEIFRELRLFQQREMLRIAARDLCRLSDVSTVTTEISNVADVCMGTVTKTCLQELQAKFGTPYAQDPASGAWYPAAFCVLGMGKLGAQELNYSSDIDVLFVYSGEGAVFKTPPKANGTGKGMPNQQFFNRLAEAIISECTRMTAEGFLFRVDMRLRPEGKTSPLARSLSSYENYYAQAGQTWERMMLIKARGVGGDEALAGEFLEMVQPFRYPRAISEQIPREVAEMKARIENEVVRAGELERNVKLGRGGIREIEFLVQTLQVLHGGRIPFLQTPKTLTALDKLADYNLLDRAESVRLKQAYCFLRDVEHRLQMESNQQTHTIPVNVTARTRLARLMGFETVNAFEKALRQHNENVRGSYEKVISPARTSGELALPREVEANSPAWQKILQAHSFRSSAQSVKLVMEFVEGPGFGHRSSRTVEHSMRLLGQFLSLCPKAGAEPPKPFLSDPDRVLARLDRFVARYGARAMLYDAWVSNPSLFRLLLLAFDRSEFLAELAIRQPDLIDEIEQSGQLRRHKTTEQILDDLRHGRQDEDQHRWLRRYFHADQMRIALRDILDLATPEQTQSEISALADAFLVYALEVVLRKNRLKKAPFAIVGLGKLGGQELIYASDLDIVFVADNSSKNLPALQKLAIQFLDLLSKRTEDGITFAADARLRPDGEKGLLVNTLSGYAEYYRKRAMLWEIQSLSRFRPITGDRSLQQQFSEIALAATNFHAPAIDLAAHTPEWKAEIQRMRLRIEKERTSSGKDALAIKTGAGGLMDVEFVAQALCLENGWHEPNTLAAIARAQREKKLPAATARTLSENYRRLIQIERILRRWSFEPETILPDDPAPFYRVAVRCGFKEAEDFATAVAGYRTAIRKAYAGYFGTKPTQEIPSKKNARPKPARRK
jgi:glutamate-ammonia-ligase adenylyltransferase